MSSAAVRSLTRALDDTHSGRFVLGLGTSHAALVEGGLGLRYERPLSALREHLDGLDAPDPVLELAGLGHQEAEPAPRLLAALGPKALALGRDRADGVLSYLVPPEHTAQARSTLGPDRTLVVESLVAIGEDKIAERINAHLSAGADHVCLQALPGTPTELPIDQWRTLAHLAADTRSQ